VNREELLKMLDLVGKEAPPARQDAELEITPHEGDSSGGPASPTALELDGWGLRRGREVLEESERLQRLDLSAEAIADFHGCAFEPDPRPAPHCVDPLRHQFVQQLLQTPEYQSLHTSTLLHEAASAIAAAAFAEQFAALKKERQGPAAGEVPDPAGEEMDTLRAVGRAVTTATEEVEECKEAEAGLGMGPGEPGSNDPRAIAALYRRVRDDPTLRRICQLAGRYRRLAQSKQRQKATHGLDDVVGVTLDGDLGRTLPHELARLAVPEFELDTLRRLVERQLMCREYHATEPVGRGPILVVVDESGSMAGDKVHTAKAMALALAWVARRQRRWCALVAYSGDTGERLLALPPGRWDEGKLADWLCQFLGGGSERDVPIAELPDYYRRLGAPLGQTDVILVTDALCRLPTRMQERFNAWRASVKAKVISLIVNSAPGDLAGVSDECHLVRSLEVSEEAVGRVLSV
jgi:uncharacterized protein with von Willebrand factor type A (vWA) domain